MTKRKPKRRTRAGPRLSPPPGDPNRLVELAPALVGGAWYRRLISTAPGLPQVVMIPGVAESNGLTEIPERLLLFRGHAPTVSISVRQVNQVTIGPTGQTVIAGQTRFLVALDDVTVYSPETPFSSLLEALVAAGAAATRLAAHPIRWQDPTAWRGHPVWYQGQRGWVAEYQPIPGTCRLALGDAPWPPGVWVDILSDSLEWSSDEPGRTDGGTAVSPAPETSAPVVSGGPADDEPELRPGNAVRGLGGSDDAPVRAGTGDSVADR